MKTSYIAGEWTPSGEATPDRNPSDLEDVVDVFAQASRNDAERAISAAAEARAALEKIGTQARSDALLAVGREIRARSGELGEQLAREEGKTTREGTAEADRAGRIFEFFAGEALRMTGEHIPSVRPGLEVEVSRSPVGVVGIITPWNFPLAIPAWKIAPALAFGCPVVFKPADLVPASAWSLAEIISRAGLPRGAFNLVIGRGAVVGQAMLESPLIDAVSFTGSTTTGRRVLETAGMRFAKLQIEMGGKNPLVVLDDADLEIALACALDGAFGSTGQRCTATSRIIVERGMHDRFVEALVARTRALVVGDARAAATTMGPVVDASQLETDLRYVAIGREEGASLLCGGERVERATEGHYLSPAIFAGVMPSMRIAREEIFGPVASVLVADDFDHAVALANDSEFGLSAGVCTQSLRHATRFKQQVHAGMVMINAPTAGVDYHVPFGGTKASSHGPREQGRHAIDFFTEWKTTYTAC